MTELHATPDIPREAHRVIGGKAGFPPIAFPHDPWAMDKVIAWTTAFVAQAGALTVRQRTLFIRKLALYVVRRGRNNLRDLDYLYGAAWFSRSPHTLESTLTFGGAMRREAAHMAYVTKRAYKDQRNAALADIQAPLTGKPVVMAHGDYVLEELVHARHLLEAGQLAGNCLVRAGSQRDLPNPYYWLGVKSGDKHLFALRKGQDLCLLICTHRSHVTEMEFVRPPEDVHLVMPLVADALQRTSGALRPAHDTLPWPSPPEPAQSSFLDPNQMFLPFGADP